MSVRRLALLALPVALAACPNVKQSPPPDVLVFASFDPATATIPLPNDLALQAAASLPAGMQKELLQSFIASGGFPSDQEVPITVTIRAVKRNPAFQPNPTYDACNQPGHAGQYVPQSAYEPVDVEDVDPATVNASTVAIVRMDGTPTSLVPEFGGFVKSAGPATPPFGGKQVGTLTIRLKAAADGSRRWPSGPDGARYVVALRGGANGVKTTAGHPVSPETTILLIAPDKDLRNPENQPLRSVPDTNCDGTNADEIAQLEQLRGLYANPLAWCDVAGTWVPPAAGGVPTSQCVAPQPPAQPTVDAYAGIDRIFPHAELATIQEFGVAPAAVTALADTGSGQLPLPSDFLLTANPATCTGTTATAACPCSDVRAPGDTTACVRNVPAFGPAAPGLHTLDGFSTTGMMLAPLSGAVQASTIDSSTVFLFDVTSGTPTLVPDLARALGGGNPSAAGYVLQPSQLDASVGGTLVTTAIGLQPGVPAPVPNVGIVPVPPLAENHHYVVVVTNGVKDLAGNPIVASTLDKIVFQFTSPIFANGSSQVPGVSDADAYGLQQLRDQLSPLVDNIGLFTGTGLTKADVVLAYPVSTQSVTGTSVLLSAAPYDPSVSAAITTVGGAAPWDPGTVNRPATDFPNVSEFLQTAIVSIDAINPATGALNPDRSAWAAGPVPALLAIPKASAIPPCPTGSALPLCAPLAVFHHGIGDSRFMMLGVADALAAKGFVVAAIDMPLHGDRAFCKQDSECQTASGAQGTCTPDPAMAGQGDAVPPGHCGAGQHLTFLTDQLQTAASGNYFVSANFFRLRDTIRQNDIDQSALVLALARPSRDPNIFPQPAADAVFAYLAGKGIAIDPTKVYSVGHSLGGLVNAQVVATNPRFARAIQSPTGGTLVDVFTSSPDFHDQSCALFASLGIPVCTSPNDPAVLAKYLQTLIVAKWILDPADPINYTAHVRTKLASPLLAAPPNGLGGTPLVHATTDVLGQLANCDTTIPDAFGVEQLGLGGIPYALYETSGAPPAGTPAGFCLDPTAGPVPHGTLVDAAFSSTPIGGTMRDQAASFLFDLTMPPAKVTLP